jgi:hypothetical protein
VQDATGASEGDTKDDTAQRLEELTDQFATGKIKQAEYLERVALIAGKVITATKKNGPVLLDAPCGKGNFKGKKGLRMHTYQCKAEKKCVWNEETNQIE